MMHVENLDAATAETVRSRAWSRVLVPLDGVAASNWALTRARHLLEQPGLAVTLLRVVECTEARAKDLSFRVDSRHREARQALAHARSHVLSPSIAARAELRFGDPVTEILREIEDARHDLVVMSTRGRTGFSRFLFGSVTDRVLRSSPVPLLLVRPWMAQGEPAEAARFERLLVVLDGLEPAEEILPWAEDIARTFGSSIHLFGGIFGGSTVASRCREAREYLDGLSAALEARGIPSQVHVCKGAVADEALALIREHGLDAVALMTHARSGLALAVYGSVAQRLIRESGVPVLVLRNRRLRPAIFARLPEHRQLWVD